MDLMVAIGFQPADGTALFDAMADGGDRVAVAAWDAALRDHYRPDVAGTVHNRLVDADRE